MQLRRTLLRLFVLGLFSVGYTVIAQNPQTRPAPGGQPDRPPQQGGGGRPNPGGGGGKPNPSGGGGNRPNPGGPQIQPVRPNPGGGNRPQPPRPNPGGPQIQPVRPNPGGNRPNPPRPNPPRPNPPRPRPPNRPGPGRPPSWGRPPASRPNYGWRPNDRSWLHRYYARNLLSITLGSRPVFAIGGFFPYAYIPYITPAPPQVYAYLPPPPPGYQIGYYQGYVVVYDPVTYYIANVIDLTQQ
jgi:hypothetical protein